MNTLMDIILTGVVESEIDWIPFALQQWDYHVERFGSMKPDSPRPMPISILPSEYFDRQMPGTFFNDAVGRKRLESWGQDNCI
jgi:hypothetical protein